MKNLLNFSSIKYVIMVFNLVFCITSYAVTSQCVQGLSEIELEGKLTIETYPGPPNYESIEEGDRKMDVWVLHLDKPVACILQNEPLDIKGELMELMEFEGGSLVRVVPSEYTNLDLTAYENQHVTIKGRILAKSSGIDLLPMVLDSLSMFNKVKLIKK